MKTETSLVEKIDSAMQGSLLLFALSAPISIAATQIAWALALVCWIVRAFLVRPRFKFDTFSLLVLGFVGLSFLSSLVSYEPRVSIGKMTSVLLITIVFLVSEYVSEAKQFRRILAALLISCSVSVVFTLATRVFGKNLKVEAMTADSPLRKLGVQEGDTILSANGRDVNSPDELVATLSQPTKNGESQLVDYRHELIFKFDLTGSALSSDITKVEELGITDWSRGRDTRATGFYGQFMTYAEALQLMMSLLFGLLIFAPGGLRSKFKIILAIAVGASAVALLFTVTRASWLAFLISAGVMLLFGAKRKIILIGLALALPIILTGLFVLQQKRNVGFIDTSDNSTSWRLTVWREGFDLLRSKPRHLLVGVGMDSLKTHWQEWQMFDGGKIPVGHMHSTPLQIALERGVPALLVWLVFMFCYLRKLLQALKRNDWVWYERGFILGAFGGTIGFLTSGLVHYNWGDSEVVMIFYLIMGLSLALFGGLSESELEKAQ